MGDFSCNKCTKTYATYHELREHKAASHKEEITEPIRQRARFQV
jgi:hypothetical protein